MKALATQAKAVTETCSACHERFRIKQWDAAPSRGAPDPFGWVCL